MSIELNHAELSTVLAALRLYQQLGYGEPCNRPLDIHDIATDGLTVMSSLDETGIDELCERLNTAPSLRDDLIAIRESLDGDDSIGNCALDRIIQRLGI